MWSLLETLSCSLTLWPSSPHKNQKTKKHFGIIMEKSSASGIPIHLEHYLLTNNWGTANIYKRYTSQTVINNWLIKKNYQQVNKLQWLQDQAGNRKDYEVVQKANESTCSMSKIRSYYPIPQCLAEYKPGLNQNFSFKYSLTTYCVSKYHCKQWALR